MFNQIQQQFAQISPRERNILLLAVGIVLFFIANTLIPAVRNSYQARTEEIDAVRLDFEREQRLIEDTAFWQSRREEVEALQDQLAGLIFSGTTIPLIEAAIQRDLTQYARDSAINVASTRLAERQEAGGWLMISQEMSFRTNDAGNTISFLRALAGSNPRLFVSDFSLDHNRQQYTGSITVIGFARSAGLTGGEVAGP